MIRALVTGVILAALSAGAASAQTVAPESCFRGKTINIVAGAGTGDGYDIYSRLLAQYMGRHIAGNPRFVVQNMPGAGTLRATNFIAEVAPKDGTYFGSVGGGTATAGLLDAKNARFDARRFGWIGSMNSEVGLVLSWGTTPFKTIKDVMKQEFIVGGGGPTSGNVVFPIVLNQVVGTRFKVVGGYKGTGDIALAVERGELHGTASYHYSSIIGRNPDWLTRKQVNVLLQLSLRKHPLFPDVPLLGGSCAERRAARDPRAGVRAPGDGPAVHAAAGYAARRRGDSAPRLRRHHARSGADRRSREAQDGPEPADDRRGDPRADRPALPVAAGDHRQGGAGGRAGRSGRRLSVQGRACRPCARTGRRRWSSSCRCRSRW